jgi:hypothetical protein
MISGHAALPRRREAAYPTPPEYVSSDSHVDLEGRSLPKLVSARLASKLWNRSTSRTRSGNPLHWDSRGTIGALSGRPHPELVARDCLDRHSEFAEVRRAHVA